MKFGIRIYFVSLQFIRGVSTGTLLVLWTKRRRGWGRDARIYCDVSKERKLRMYECVSTSLGLIWKKTPPSL